ncbi:aminoglycoside phosphotransferase family protein [Robbsia andropogonis]|uniref:aminoglycoside phosphotransferase family protein n=1 Tax=Robbsia andropogonis TaxID=28092 RepID=UPI000463E08F|nr:phosphotransferase [Robbsia andropogonis]MCP1117034.1 phosphotransferase [Robbsia andropogonis]MCP1128381.1 phosphotransferase [Robbsia andropogonis]
MPLPSSRAVNNTPPGTPSAATSDPTLCISVAAAGPPTPAESADARHQRLIAWLSGLSAGAPTDALAPQADDLASLLPLDFRTLQLASSDAGFRRYFRIRTARGDTAIVMDAPPPEKSREFRDVQQLLKAAGIHVPAIYAADVDAGFMLLSDLGSTAYIDVLDGTNEDRAKPLMRDALRTLIRWQKASRPDILPPYDEALLRRELDLFPEWYADRHLGRPFDDTDKAMYADTCRLLVEAARQQPQVFVHRDFMPRNLMLSDPAPAVIDFQDAVHGPIGYDVAALLRDAFLSWDEAFEIDCVAWYWGEAKAAGLPVNSDFALFYRDVEWIGLQRHLKILGLFARLQYRDGKPRYLADTPRFFAYASRVAHRYRELRPLARLLDKYENRNQQVGYTF